ncbi:DUF6308 family protein [Dactylosporangium sp. NBC_01737]|uniref:DUF6308 family protein n=1 Tax=Dactylosporangium sp. NBC_01737 TaxID=2975959 RepID=UPI002E0DE2C1|nr:DUF6308 family protein [Dactylosporangium sp. NBC_01737]
MTEKLIDIADREGVDHLEAYFAPSAYTGQWFETFAGGGDRAETRDRITAEDLYAVQALKVQVPFAVGREILEGQRRVAREGRHTAGVRQGRSIAR